MNRIAANAYRTRFPREILTGSATLAGSASPAGYALRACRIVPEKKQAWEEELPRKKYVDFQINLSCSEAYPVKFPQRFCFPSLFLLGHYPATASAVILPAEPIL